MSDQGRKLLLFAWILVVCTAAFAQDARHFTFHYGFTVKNIPAGEKVRVWIPAAHSDAFQQVKVVSATGDLPLIKSHESKFDNEMYYGESAKSAQLELHFEIVYDVIRHERVALKSAQAHITSARLNARDKKQYLAPDTLVPTTGLPAQLAEKVVAGKDTPLDKARAIYDYVFTTMKYDKSGTGWGRGDVLYACDAKRGNCTDFHSLFIAMARSQNIPARFEIGFPLPSDKHSAEVAGYHCWSDFYLQDRGWVPVDISEAWKHPDKRDYFFGSHDVNRVQFSMGRDLRLNPVQDGAPLNYFVYPYVEVGGKKYENVSLAFSFADVGSATTARLR